MSPEQSQVPSVFRRAASQPHWLGIVVGLIGVNLANIHAQPWVLDDAYITFRYAENLAEGHGLVYNLGEYVEGSTTLLWTLLLAGAHALHISVIDAAQFLGILSATATVFLAGHAHVFIKELPRNVSAMAAVLLGAWPPFGTWAESGMEVPFVALLVLLSILLYLRWQSHDRGALSALGCAFACGLLFMARPECGLVFGAMVIDLALRFRRANLKGAVFFVVLFCIIVAAVTAWRWHYFGDYVPNTFRTKVGATLPQLMRGLRYFERFAMPSMAALFPVMAGFFLTSFHRHANGRFFVLGVFLVLHTLYVIAVGGDVMPAFRFFATVLPVAALFAAISLATLLTSPLRMWSVVAVAFAFGTFTIYDEGAFTIRDPVSRNGKTVGRFMRENYPPDTLLATNSAGAIPYFSKLPIIDMLGLCDRTIALTQMPNMGRGQPGHEKGNGRYVLSRKPDVIQFGSSSGNKDPTFIGDREISKMDDFRKNYVLKEYKIDRVKLVVYERKEFSARLNKLRASKNGPVIKTIKPAAKPL